MQRTKFMVKHFLNQPLWFKILVTSTFLISIIFSSSFFSNQAVYESFSKLAAAVFFGTCGYKMRGNLKTAVILFGAAAICLILSITAI
jgi:hypothetical protein